MASPRTPSVTVALLAFTHTGHQLTPPPPPAPQKVTTSWVELPHKRKIDLLLLMVGCLG